MSDKQREHLARARAINEAKNPHWRGKKPSKETVVREWQLLHRTKTCAECSKELNLNIKTVKKWWNWNLPVLSYDELMRECFRKLIVYFSQYPPR